MKRNRVAAMVICFLAGPVGIHLIYLGEYHRAKKRFLWFFFCNPVAFYNTLLDLGRLGFMSQYEFNSKYCIEKVKGSETYSGLHVTINKIEQDMKK